MTASATATTTATRQTITLPIDTGTISLRSLSPQRSRFELEYALERGSTANSFLFEGDGNHAAVLVHPPGAAYGEVFLPALTAVMPEPNQKLLVVVGHVNPNRVALLRELAATYTELELLASNAGAKVLNELWSLRKPAPPGELSDEPALPDLPPIRVIRHEQSMPLSHGRTLLLLPAPTPR